MFVKLARTGILIAALGVAGLQQFVDEGFRAGGQQAAAATRSSPT